MERLSRNLPLNARIRETTFGLLMFSVVIFVIIGIPVLIYQHLGAIYILALCAFIFSIFTGGCFILSLIFSGEKDIEDNIETNLILNQAIFFSIFHVVSIVALVYIAFDNLSEYFVFLIGALLPGALQVVALVLLFVGWGFTNEEQFKSFESFGTKVGTFAYGLTIFSYFVFYVVFITFKNYIL